MKRIFTFLVSALTLLNANAARIDTLTVQSPNLPTPMTILVTVPENIDTAQNLPVVYLLHGYSGDQNDWLRHQPRIKDMADQYGMIIVNPDGRNTWYFDSPEKPEIKMESFIINDLIPYIDNKYPTAADRTKRAITGLSMGGHGALYLAFRHPDLFANAGSMSGGVDIRPFPEYWEIKTMLGDINQYPERWEANSVINLVDRLKPGEININFDCGIDDFFAKVNENLHIALVKAGIPHDYTSRPGAHTWEYWNNSLMHHLLYFSEAFRK